MDAARIIEAGNLEPGMEQKNGCAIPPVPSNTEYATSKDSASKPAGYSARSGGFRARRLSSGGSGKTSPSPTAAAREMPENCPESSSKSVGFSARKRPQSVATSGKASGIPTAQARSLSSGSDEIAKISAEVPSFRSVGFSARNLPQSARVRLSSSGSVSPSIDETTSSSPVDVESKSVPQTPSDAPHTPQQGNLFKFTAMAKSPQFDVSKIPGASTNKPSPTSNRTRLQAAARKDWFNSKRPGLTSPTPSDCSQSSDDAAEPRKDTARQGVSSPPSEENHTPGVKPRTRNLSSPSKLGCSSSPVNSESIPLLAAAGDLRRTLSNPESSGISQLAPNDLRRRLSNPKMHLSQSDLQQLRHLSNPGDKS